MPTNAKTFVIGRVRPTFEGSWDAAKTYKALALVSYRGEAYMAQQDVPVNREPDITPDYWVKVGGKGDKGAQGERGMQGTAGRDGTPGIQGPQGVGPRHQWAGTTLVFENPDGTWADPTDLKGPQGIQGPEGPIGPQGIEGPIGAQGPAGPAGPQGPAGPLPALSNAVDSESPVTAASSLAVKLAYDKAASVILSDAVNSTRSDVAASSRAIKTAYDLAQQAKNAVPNLSSAVNSNSNTTAATSAAVKAAYDLAQQAKKAVPPLSSEVTSSSTSVAASSFAVKYAYDTAMWAKNSAPVVQDSLNSYSTVNAGSANAVRIAYEAASLRPYMPWNQPRGDNLAVYDYAALGIVGLPKTRFDGRIQAPLGGTWFFFIPGTDILGASIGILNGGGLGPFREDARRGFMWRIQ